MREAMTNEELHDRIDWNLTNHPPIGEDIVDRFEVLRILAKEFSHAIVDLCPPGRDQSLALTHAEDALMRAVAAIARNQEGLEPFAPDDGVPFAYQYYALATFETSGDLEEIASEALTERATEGTVEEVLVGADPASYAPPEHRSEAEVRTQADLTIEGQGGY